MSKSPSKSGLSRREALGTLALGGLAACSRRADPYNDSQPPPPPGKRTWDRRQERAVLTACGQCPAGCSVRVRVVEGRAVGITGADSPVNRGGIGPRGIASLQGLYDPDRIRTPLIRRPGSTPRHTRALEPATWDEALRVVGDELKGLRDNGKADRLVAMCGRDRGVMLDLWRRFTRAYGTPNLVRSSAWSMGAIPHATNLMLGSDEVPGYDWNEVDYVLTLGSGILETACQRVYFLRAAADLVRGRQGRRAHVVHADPSLPTSTTMSDEWLPIRPATHGLLALALCHVLVRDELYDAQAAQHLGGFDDADDRMGFRSWILANYAPENVAAACDVSPETIERIAHEMAARQPAIAVIDPTATLTTEGVSAARAVMSLNALLGAFHRDQGRVFAANDVPLAPWPELSQQLSDQPTLAKPRIDGRDALVLRTDGAPDSLCQTLTTASPPAAEALLLYYANPCFSASDPKRWRKALDAVPFVVSFSPYMDDTVSEHVDVVLPDTTYLERWEDGAPAPATEDRVFVLRQPAVEPRHEARATGDVLLGLAAHLGEDVAAAFPWKNFRKALEARVEGLQGLQRGSFTASKAKSFFKKLRRKGVWIDDQEIETAPPRVELTSPAIPDELESLAGRRNATLETFITTLGPSFTTETSHLPVITIPEAPKENIEELLLLPYTPSTYAVGSGANQSWLRTLNHGPAGTPVQINPATAERLQLQRGTIVDVTSETGTIRCSVVLFEGVRPDCVRIPRGMGHSAMGRWAAGLGSNVMELLPANVNPWTGLANVDAVRVKVRKT